MLKKNRSAPNTAVIPVWTIPTYPKQSRGSRRPFHSPNVSALAEDRRQLLHGTGAIVVAKPGVHAQRRSFDTAEPRGALRHTSCHGDRRYSLDAPRRPVLVDPLNPRITCMANANARSSTHGDIRGRFRRRFSIPTQPTGAVNS